MEPEQRVGLAVVAVFFLIGLGWILWGNDAMAIRSAKEVAAHELIDPSSAQFRNLRTAMHVDNVICGEINSKNRLGAYVGFTEFVVVRGRVQFSPSSDAADLSRRTWDAVRGLCD